MHHYSPLFLGTPKGASQTQEEIRMGKHKEIQVRFILLKKGILS